ncbi:unnamed protein product [Caenorhabditis sp. 36 PRJEB53466]|nr:unnamed protein product [Caenorhabditis sp. 36 PRJEB53466]
MSSSRPLPPFRRISDKFQPKIDTAPPLPLPHKDGLDSDKGSTAHSPATPDADAADLEMPAGESAQSPAHGDAVPVNVCHNESGDEGPRKRSASPATASQSTWNNPAKKICTEGIDLWVQSTSEAVAVPDVTSQYQDNHDTLTNMGFNSEEIDSALRMSNNDVEKAVQFLTREISGLDPTPKQPPSSADKPKPPITLPELLRHPYVESDEEEVAENMKTVWDEESMNRLRIIIDTNHKFVIFHQNGSLHRRMIVATNILAEKKNDRMADVLNFVDEFLSIIIARHVNCSDPPYIGEADAQAIEQFYLAITPLLCNRLVMSPSTVKTVLAIDEMFNFRNKFFIQGVQFIDPPDRVYPPLKYIDIERLERVEYKPIYAYLADVFLEALIPTIESKTDVTTDEELFEVTLLDWQCLLRSLNIFTNYINRANDLFLCKLEGWVAKALDRFRVVTDKEIRDALVRRQGLDLLQEVVILCDRFGLDVAVTTQAARLDYLRKWIKCPQMESILHALEELGTIADRFHRTGGMTITRPKSHVNEEYFKTWLEENKVLQIVLTGNMDHVVYVERIQPILQYMTPELTFDDMKFVWSLRKGRMGVSVDNFNKIMEFISKSVNNEQIEWLIDLFKKSFRSRETRLYEPIFNFCSTIAVQKDRDDECKLKISNIIWELIYIARGPPRCHSFKSLEYGMKKHCDLLNMMHDKSERDAFLDSKLDALNTDEGFNEITIAYLYIMLDKMKRLFTPKRSFSGEDALHRTVRQMAHEAFDAAQQANPDSQSNAVYESTSDTFAGHPIENILTTSIYGCTDYSFVLTNTLKLLKWLHDIDASIVDMDYVQRVFSIFIERPDATPQEKAEIFAFLFEIRIHSMRSETSRAIITHLCGMDMCTLQITGLRCFCKYWEELPILSNEEHRPVESFLVANDVEFQKDNECKLFIWKLILFNQYDDVVEKCMETFCERDLVLVESPYAVRHHTYSFLSVFSFYVEKLKSELYKRSNKPITAVTYETSELVMSEEEVKQYDVPLEGMLTETIARALNRLVRFMTRFIELGNEKNHMIRENPSHGSSVPGHPVTLSIELKNDDDDLDCGINNWKTLVVDSSTTIGEFKVRLAKRLLFHENMTEFTVHKREEDLTMAEANLKYDFLTLQNVKICAETDSIFLSEKLRILVKPNPYRKSTTRRQQEPTQSYLQKKALREDFLPMSIISKCNFYELLHELAQNGDKHIRASVRKLLLLLPTQPSLLSQITLGEMQDDEDDPLSGRIMRMYREYMTPQEPGRMLYALETLSSLVAPTRLTSQACEESGEVTAAVLESGIVKVLVDEVLNKPHVVPLNKCSPGDRHAIFERVLQIIRTVFTGHNTFLKMIYNESRVRDEMKKTCERMQQSRQTPRSMEQNMDYALIKQQILPPPLLDNDNNPTYSTSIPICGFRNICSTFMKIVNVSLKKWTLGELVPFLENIRNFQWVHVATENLVAKPMAAFLKPDQDPDPLRPTASEIIRINAKGERWGDECRLIIVKKCFALTRHMVQVWIRSHPDESLHLLTTLFLKPSWTQFYQDVLVNSQQEAYRKYVQESIVKIGKENFEVSSVSLKMLLEMFRDLPLHTGYTDELSELHRRQRQHCDGIVQTISEVFFYESSHRGSDGKDFDWIQIGQFPIQIVRGQISSLLDFKPRFRDIEANANEFLDAIINDFMFPELPDIEDSMFEEESIRWENNAREVAMTTVNSFCERSYKCMYQLLLMWNKFPIAQRPYDPSYRPIIRGRQHDKVGLKNDGGTCYMNATIQQLVHVPGLARELIAIKDIDPTLSWGDNTSALLCELQRVFVQLNFSRCQAIIPSGLWREFRFEPDMPLNTKQHHDAIDFYSILLDKCDNVLKKLELPPLFQNRFFGKYSYEKICYGCWHRYKSPDEEFNCVSLALSGDNLEEALENFLAAHVMEGENAYHCEKCNEKKTTLNRSSFLELPSTMTIQLKRFTYDLVNNMIRKDNQFFKFPFEIDMTPYMTTSRHVPDEQVQDLFDEMLWGNTAANDEPATPPHKNGTTEKSLGQCSASNPSLESPQKKLFRRHRSSNIRLSQSFVNSSGFDTPTQQQKPLIYELVGVLAHSGIATAGHYYSFIKERREEYRDSPTYGKWYHVNDQIINPMPLNTIDDIWFGGTFTQDGVFIGLDERIRHWNAYVLFYEKKRDEPDMLIPRHIIDRSEESRPKVTFDVSDEQMDDGEDRMKEAQEALRKDMSEARKLRITMFKSLDTNLKKFLNEEHCKFLEDRDFFSFDLYQIYINSLQPLLRREETVEYTVGELTKLDFNKMAFEYVASYVIRIAWLMFDDARPKNFPRSATEVIKILLNAHPENKTFFFKALEANNSEMLTRMLESTEYDVRNAFWVSMKCALRLWVIENGRKDEHIMEPSPDSTDIDDDDEEDDDDDEDDELEDEDSETEEIMRDEIMRPNPMALVANLINQARPPPQKSGNPVDLSKNARPQRVCTNPVERMLAAFPYQLNIVRRIVQILPFRSHRMDSNGRHYSRHPIEILYMISKQNEFGKTVLCLIHSLPIVADFLFEEYSTIFCRLRFPEDRLKGLGLWPSLPGLYFELLLDHLNRNSVGNTDPQMQFRHAIMTPSGRFCNEVVSLYCVSRDECEMHDRRTINDEKAIHNRILTCYVRQIEILIRTEIPDAPSEYLFNISQTVLKENFMDAAYNLIPMDQWRHVIEFFTELSLKLLRCNMAELGVQFLKDVLWVGVAEDDDAVHHGVLPIMIKWKDHDYMKFRKLGDALLHVRRMKHPEFRSFLSRSVRRFHTVFSSLGWTDDDDENDMSDEPMEEEEEDLLIGPQQLRRAENSVDLTKAASDVVATARVTETKEINLEQDLRMDHSDAEEPPTLTEQPRVMTPSADLDEVPHLIPLDEQSKENE